MAQWVKRLPAMQETQVRFLDREDPLEKEIATHSSTLAWKTHGQRSLVAYSTWGCKESDMTDRFHSHFHSCIAGGFFTAELPAETPLGTI